MEHFNDDPKDEAVKFYKLELEFEYYSTIFFAVFKKIVLTDNSGDRHIGTGVLSRQTVALLIILINQCRVSPKRR